MRSKFFPVFACATLLAASAFSQEAPAPFETAPYDSVSDEVLFALWTGEIEDFANSAVRKAGADAAVTENAARSNGGFVKYEMVGDEKAPWISINFGDFNLGNNSFLQVRSVDSVEPQVQWFDQETLEAWRGRTALFNGSYLEIFLFASPDDTEIDYEIESVDLGLAPNEELKETISNQQDAIPGTEAMCGEDDRIGSADHRIGRIMPVGCTGWTINGDKFLTAGHCVGSRMQYLQFEVPASEIGGTPRHPSSDKQYKIIPDSVLYVNGGIGNDWAIFRVASPLGQSLPKDRYGFFEVRREENSSNLMVRGYGLDDDPAGSPPTLRNNSSQTQQEHVGDFVSTDKYSKIKAVIKHRIDTRGGNSGSPIFHADEPDVAIGIHTHGGCNTSKLSFNRGTSFLNDALWEEIQR